MKPKIVVLDGATLNPGDNPWTEVESLGCLTVHDRTPAGSIVKRASAAQIVLTNKTPLRAETLRALPDLKFISVLATGHNVVDSAAARGLGIAVSNVPEYASESVAQHVFALLLELGNRVAAHDRQVRDGRWCEAEDFCFWDTAPLELAGLTMGLVGLGKIGSRVAKLAHAFGMRVVAYTPSRSATPPCADFAWVELDELFACADVVSLHCPQTEDNRELVNAERLRSMKPSALLLNTARGALVSEQALAAALSAGSIAGAALDVVSVEPMAADSVLLGAPNCVITPHMAWAALPARRRLMAQTASNIRAFLSGAPINVVNGS